MKRELTYEQRGIQSGIVVVRGTSSYKSIHNETHCSPGFILLTTNNSWCFTPD